MNVDLGNPTNTFVGETKKVQSRQSIVKLFMSHMNLLFGAVTHGRDRIYPAFII
jgi:hypothetical protein